MKNPLISIIVPVYNVEKYLAQCIESLIHQTYDTIEIILINDASSDNSLSIIERYALTDKRIKFVTQKNTGLSGARNKGMEIAQGSYIMFVDSDDWLDLETCSSLVSKLNEKDYDVLFWPYVREYENYSLNKDILDCDTDFNQKGSEALHLRIFGLTGNQLAKPDHADSIVTACMKLYKASIIKDNEILFFDTQLIGTEDALFNCQYFNFVTLAYYHHKHFYHYRRDNIDSLTSKNKPNLHKQWNTLFMIMKAVIEKYKLDDTFTVALNNRIALSIVGLGINEMNASYGISRKMENLTAILNSDLHKNALNELTLKYFPPHWKIFFYFAKKRFVVGVFSMLQAMNYFINRKKQK